MQPTAYETLTRPARLPHWLPRAGWVVAAIVHVILALAPLLALAGLYALSWRGAVLIGHWPVKYGDGSPDIGRYDPLYLFLYEAWTWFAIAACFGLPLLLALTIVHSRKYAHRWPILLLMAYVACWLLFFYEPGRRLIWYID